MTENSFSGAQGGGDCHLQSQDPVGLHPTSTMAKVSVSAWKNHLISLSLSFETKKNSQKNA
jgi:hypothetical protein